MKLKIFVFAVALTLATNLSAQTFTTLHSFTGSDGVNSQAGLILSGNSLYGTMKVGGGLASGTLFKVNTDGSVFTNLHNFAGSDGFFPNGLILSGYTLYGTTSSGGSSGNGTLFKVNADGSSFTCLYSFTNSPYANLILSGNTLYGAMLASLFRINTDGSNFTNFYTFTGNNVLYPSCLLQYGNTLYGTSSYGGSVGTVFKVNTDGTGFMILHSFSYTNSEGSFPNAIVLSGNTLYGTGGTLFKVNSDGTGFTVLHSFAGNDGANPDGLILSGNTLYGTTSSGGSSGYGTVFAVNTDGSSFAVLHTFTTGSGTIPNVINSDGANPQAGLILSGNTLYGTTEYGGSSGNGTVFALTLAPSSQYPQITTQPVSQAIQAGSNVTFNVLANGQSPLHYQWRFNGQNISNATNTTLTLNSVSAANSGGYSVVVSNPYGSATSTTASLAVLTEGANGNKPTQISVPLLPPKPPNKDSLVVITHGWEPLQPNADLSWMTAMANAIQSRVASNWSITNFVWVAEATLPDADLVLCAAETKGRLYGQQLASQGWSHIHFIGHSAGAALIETAAAQIPLSTTVQCTFLDPYVGLVHQLKSAYGANADWSDCYFSQDISIGWTGGRLPHAYNVDVDWLDPKHDTLIYGSSLIAISTELGVASHGYPHDFYTQTATNIDLGWCAAGYGFGLSAEAGGETKWASHPTGNSGSPVVLCGPPNAIPSPTLPIAIIGITWEQAPHVVSDAIGAVVHGAGFLLNSIFSVPQAQVKSGGVHPLDASNSTNTPAWLAVGVTVSNAVNFIQFDAGFTDTNTAEGLLTVYWNTNLVGMVDERVAATNLQTYRFALPGTVTNGIYTLSFRLDSFTNSSSIAVTNVATGFVGVTQPITLGISLTNGTPLLQLTAATNVTYLIQSSTNLVNWTPRALLVNSNGTVLFPVPAATNANAQFYRAVMP